MSPTSKAGSVATTNRTSSWKTCCGRSTARNPWPRFDGHSTCFIVTGYEQASLIDFNYKVEPLRGKYPFPGLGPFTLLGESHFNYWGKMMFKWVYFNMMLKGKELPWNPRCSWPEKCSAMFIMSMVDKGEGHARED